MNHLAQSYADMLTAADTEVQRSTVAIDTALAEEGARLAEGMRAYATCCAERDEWTAAEAYRTSKGAAHVMARAVFWPLVRAERARLRGQRAELRAAAIRAQQRQRAA